MNTRIPLKKIDYAIYHDPSLIPVLFKDTSISKGLLYSRLRRAVPHSVGIEFEGSGEFINHWYHDHMDLFNSDKVSDKDVANYFGVMSIECDTPLNTDYINRLSNYSNPAFDGNLSEPGQSSDGLLEEIRVRVRNFTQLNGLKRVLDAMRDYVDIPIGGGIHIHVDLSNYIRTDYDNRRRVIKKYLTNHLGQVEKIFPKYDGAFNRREVGDIKKSTYVNISGKNTLEFRIAPLTHDYSELIKWIVGCCKLTSEVISRCHLSSINPISKSEERDCIDGRDDPWYSGEYGTINVGGGWILNYESGAYSVRSWDNLSNSSGTTGLIPI